MIGMKVMERLAEMIARAGRGKPYQYAPTGRGGLAVETTLDALSTTGSAAGDHFGVSGHVLLLSYTSHASASLEVAFDGIPTHPSGWQPCHPGVKVARPDGRPFDSFRVRRRSTTPSNSNAVIFVVDPDELGGSHSEQGRLPNVNSTGSADMRMKALKLDGTETDVRASDEGALAQSFWTGVAYVRALGTTAGRLGVSLIGTLEGITGGAGAVAANTPRMTLASDDPAVTALQVMDDWDEADRAKVNPIVGQAGIAGDVGAPGATTTRTAEATPATVAFGAVTIDTTATGVEIRAADAGRAALVIHNNGAVTIYVGAGSVTTANGIPVLPGEKFTAKAGTQIKAITAAGSADVRFWEET